ncbi:PREDICTED: Down syndrome cell adhesion molecule homolog, partial [Papilio polytes]|uniref:Down syndrome cell adhesion molecule homolog n=1 Tax=Papilio polytes TaxID=76194 RepID=UPI00067605C0
MSALGPAGTSPPSAELIAGTSGGPSKAALEKHLFTSNSSCVRLNLLTWDSNGCPITHFVISVKGFEESQWRTESVSLEGCPRGVHAVCALAP